MKKIERIKKIAVVGAGTMGQGIAQMSAMCGFDTLLFDMSEEATKKASKQISLNLEKAVLLHKISEEEKEKCMQRLVFSSELKMVTGDVIIEAIIEDLTIKQQLFNSISLQNDEDTVFASNTSSIPITQIARGILHPERVVGMHFFNPAHLMKLVEVISGAATDEGVATCIFELAKKMGKTAVFVKDSPGFVVNRVARHYYVEALKLMEENVAPFESIDRQMESLDFKMGPFRLMDLIGVDTNFSVTSSMYASFHQDAKFRPSRIQQQKVDAGFHGKKTGKGFYEYK